MVASISEMPWIWSPSLDRSRPGRGAHRRPRHRHDRRAAGAPAPPVRARQGCGRSWHSDDYVFTLADGRPVRPDWLTHRLHHLVATFGLPPIRFHDLRQGAAILALAAHVDMKIVQHMLGHANFAFTAKHLHHRPNRSRPHRRRSHRSPRPRSLTAATRSASPWKARPRNAPPATTGASPLTA